MWTFIWVFVGIILVCTVIATAVDAGRTPAQRRRANAKQVRQTNASFGPKNPALVCPHCTTQGGVRTKSGMAKKGISGGKATGALLTGGVSLLATGLSRKEAQTEARCDNCKSAWLF